VKALFKKLLARRQTKDTADVEALRGDFKSRYHNFKLLLRANNKALEAMAEIQVSLSGAKPFGMAFVRARCTAVSVNVFTMIKQIEELAPGKYGRLSEMFSAIQQQIDQILSPSRAVTDERLTIELGQVDRHMADRVGAKMANLAQLKRFAEAKIPEGFIITATAYHRFLDDNDLQAEIDRRIQTTDPEHIEDLYSLCAELQQMIIRAKIPDDLRDAVMQAVGRVKASNAAPVTLALRSSALGEDSADSSFAGQYRSVLNVSAENILSAYKEVVASKYSLQAISYRLLHGYRDEDMAMCVGCMTMVAALAGGVIYTCHPVRGQDDRIYINAAVGLPKTVVDGSDVCDQFVVTRTSPMEIVSSEVREKKLKFQCLPEEGVCRSDLLGEEGRRASLAPDQVLALARLAVQIEAYYGVPQDIEWAIDQQQRIYLLQCRPLASSPGPAQPPAPQPVLGAEAERLCTGGITASAGAACGRVLKVEKGPDILQFTPGSILAVRQALPRWASLLNRAAAVVAEEGGFAGHLANVAREFGVPALFGVAGLMSTLTSGDLITVDADGRCIYRGCVPGVLRPRPAPPHPMVRSPVYAVLKKASEHILPLNLLDPDTPDFRPDHCRSLHDITRFIHEKSVHEMFNFGREHQFSERSSKQLFYKVPMQWWVLNLDDGFKEEVRGRYVHLSNIVSIPMLAFWEGFAAIPWDGPPPIDGKGLVAVMFQSTTNRALTTGMRSKFADRNYFMISKHFCNLNSRLGYHFSILEAMVSERVMENYVSFQFKGGAADPGRRALRTQFIADILEKYDFAVTVKEDTLLARLEGRHQAEMANGLKVLGYLTLHTRQLDMIMTNEAKVAYYRDKLTADIDRLISPNAAEN
jgi:pyruvate,water dikinase